MHTGWNDLLFKNNLLLAVVSLVKLLVKKNAFVRIVDQVKDILKLQAFSCSYRCHYVYQLQKDSLFDH